MLPSVPLQTAPETRSSSSYYYYTMAVCVCKKLHCVYKYTYSTSVFNYIWFARHTDRTKGKTSTGCCHMANRQYHDVQHSSAISHRHTSIQTNIYAKVKVYTRIYTMIWQLLLDGKQNNLISLSNDLTHAHRQPPWSSSNCARWPGRRGGHCRHTNTHPATSTHVCWVHDASHICVVVVVVMPFVRRIAALTLHRERRTR